MLNPDEKFFEWLESNNKLDFHEGALETSEDYAECKKTRLKVLKEIKEHRIEYSKTI